MPLPVVSALAYIAVSAIIALGVGLLLWADVGWAVFALGLLAQLAYHLKHFFLLDRWSRQPSPELELGGDGVWYEPFSRVYRHERELRRQIDALHAELGRFSDAGQALSDGVIALGAGGRIDWCNRSAEHYLGLDRRTDIGQPITNIVRQPAFVAYLNSGDYSTPLRLQSGRGSENCFFSVRIVTYGPDRLLVQIKDTTQAERLDQMRRDFVANVSHELRTPLTVLNGFLETLRELELQPEERNSYLALMAEQSDRMLRIIQDLLTLSSMEAAPPSKDERVDTVTLIDKLMRDAQALSGGRHAIRLKTEGHGDLRGSEAEIGSALGNLVSNAVRYTPAGGVITLSWRVGTEGAEFAVEDSGIGIEPQHIPRLTERFYRVDRGRSRESGGTGLGLAIVKHALARHQASLDIKSTPGKGSRFAVRFPSSRVVLTEPPVVEANPCTDPAPAALPLASSDRG